MLIQTQRLYKLFADEYGVCLFEYIRDEDDPEGVFVMEVDHDTWVALGAPRTITVTIVPGDTLNT